MSRGFPIPMTTHRIL